MKKTVCSVLIVLFFALSAQATVKNVIVLVPDGCDNAVQTAARYFKQAHGDDSGLAVDMMSTAMCRTNMANSIVTGSAAAATAFSTGEKTTVRFLSVGADENVAANLTGLTTETAPYAPIETILEAAKAAGKSTGLISTSRVTHATPGAYGCHIEDRGDDNDIMKHMVYQNIDVVFGGGSRHLIPTSEGGKRTDGVNLIEVLESRGVTYVDNKTDFEAMGDVDKAWGLFNASHMDADIDRDEMNPDEPSIAEMTAKALDILSKNEDGFFIMVEGSQVDWAGHQNDPAWMVTDFIAFDDAVKVALDFAMDNGDTMVIAFPDHDCGGLSIAHEQLNKAVDGVFISQAAYKTEGRPKYTDTSIEYLIDPIKDANVTLSTILESLPADGTATAADVRQGMVDGWGQWWADTNNMSDAQAQEIANQLNALGAYGAGYPLATYISLEFTAFGWTSHDHTGEDVVVWTYVDGDAQGPEGVIDNTDLAKTCAEALGVTLDGSAEWDAYDVSVLNGTELDAQPIATIDGVQYKMNTNIKIVDGQEVETKYVSVVNVSGDEVVGQVYIPKM